MIYLALGRYEEALAFLQKLREISGDEEMFNLAFVYAKQGKKKEADPGFPEVEDVRTRLSKFKKIEIEQELPSSD